MKTIAKTHIKAMVPVACTGMFMLAMAQTSSAQNVLVDPNFNGPFTANPITTTSGPGGISGVDQGWAVFGSAQSTAEVYPGDTYSLLAQNAPGNNWNPQGAYQVVNGISAGLTYTLSANFLTDTGTTYGTPVDLQLNFGNLTAGGWTTVGSSYNWGFGSPQATSGAIPSIGQWYSGSLSATAPVGASEAEVYVFFMDNGQASTENVYFDDVTMAAPEPATISLLAMGSALPFFLLRRKVK